MFGFCVAHTKIHLDAIYSEAPPLPRRNPKAWVVRICENVSRLNEWDARDNARQRLPLNL